MSRHIEREHAFIVGFESLFDDSDINDIISNASEALEWDKSDYVEAVSVGVFEKREELDEIINRYLKRGWSTARISKVTLALLRLAIYEIKYVDDVPESVAVNEAVELCKEYATETDASLLNGILGSVIKGL